MARICACSARVRAAAECDRQFALAKPNLMVTRTPRSGGINNSAQALGGATAKVADMRGRRCGAHSARALRARARATTIA